MPVPSPRNKILPARGDFADLQAGLAELFEGEICYAFDQDQYYQKEGGVLVAVGATKAQGLLAESALQSGDNISELINDMGYLVAGDIVDAPVQSVNGKTGVVVLDSDDVGAPSDAEFATLEGRVLANEVAHGNNLQKDAEQDGRLDAVESKNAEQDGRLDAVQVKDSEQDGRLDAAEIKDSEQDGRLDAVESDITSLESDVASIDLALDSKADLVNGVIPTNQIPAIAITEFLGDVSSEAEMLALTGQPGDWCFRSDEGFGYVIVAEPPSSIENWQQIATPGGDVNSVNGQTGTVVLSAADVGAIPATELPNLAPSTINLQTVTVNGNVTNQDITAYRFIANPQTSTYSGYEIAAGAKITTGYYYGQTNDGLSGNLSGFTSYIVPKLAAATRFRSFTSAVNPSGAQTSTTVTEWADYFAGSGVAASGLADKLTNAKIRGFHAQYGSHESGRVWGFYSEYGAPNYFNGHVLLGGTGDSNPNITLSSDGTATFKGDPATGAQGTSIVNGSVISSRAANETCFKTQTNGSTAATAKILGDGSASFGLDNITLRNNGSAKFNWYIDSGTYNLSDANSIGCRVNGAAGVVTAKQKAGVLAPTFNIYQGTNQTAVIQSDGSASFADDNIIFSNDGTIQATNLTDGTTSKTMTEVLESGGMDPADKAKLDGIEAGAQVNVMSAADKTKLDGIEAGATAGPTMVFGEVASNGTLLTVGSGDWTCARNSKGYYTVTFNTALVDTNYVVMAVCLGSGVGRLNASVLNKTAASFQVATWNLGSNIEARDCAFGFQVMIP